MRFYNKSSLIRVEYAEDERRTVEAFGDDIGIDEDAGADDPADHDHRRVEGAQGALERHG